MRYVKTKAIILRRRNFFEADRLMVMLTERQGKLRVLAKGARRLTSRLGGRIEPYNLLDCKLVEGKSFYILTEAQMIRSFMPLREKNIYLRCEADYAAELLDRLVHEQEPVLPIYKLTEKFLINLGKNNNLITNRLGFVCHLLKYLGILPELFKCSVCENKLKPSSLAFSVSSGGALCPNHIRVKDAIICDKNTIKAIRILSANFPAPNMPEAIIKKAKILTNRYLHWTIGEPIKSERYLRIKYVSISGD